MARIRPGPEADIPWPGWSRCSAAPTLALIVRIFGRAGALVTVRVNAWVAVPFLFLAVRVSRYTPAAAFAGVPEIVAVPSPLSVNRHARWQLAGLGDPGCGITGRGHRERERRPEGRCGSGTAGEGRPVGDGSGRDRDGNRDSFRP